MTPQEFEIRLADLRSNYGAFYDRNAPTIAAKVAVDFFKESFQTESWQRKPWKEVQRRMGSWERGGKTIKSYAQGADTTRKILTGKTGDLGRSIEQDRSRTGRGQTIVWTNPSKFANSQKIYAAVHNEGLRAGRGAGFKMPKRQFMGEDPNLNRRIIEELTRKLIQLTQQR